MSATPRQMLKTAAGCVVALAALMVLAYYPPQTRWLDAAALDGFTAIARPGVNGIATRLADAFNPFPYAIVVALLLAAALKTRGLRTALATGAFLFAANATTQILKPLLAHHRELWRTEFQIYNIQDASFPSGHATAAMAFALAAIIIAPRAYRPATALAAGGLTLAASFSILILSRHLPSDVVGGYLVATAWGLTILAGLRYADDRWPEQRKDTRTVLSLPPPSTAAVALIAAFGAAVATGVALSRADALASFADRHTAFVAVAGAMTVAAALLIAAVLALSGTRRSS